MRKKCLICGGEFGPERLGIPSPEEYKRIQEEDKKRIEEMIDRQLSRKWYEDIPNIVDLIDSIPWSVVISAVSLILSIIYAFF